MIKESRNFLLYKDYGKEECNSKCICVGITHRTPKLSENLKENKKDNNYVISRIQRN